MIKDLLKSEFGKGTIILFFTMNVYNFLNFLFHFAMGRMLGPSDYGVLAVLMSIVYIYGVPTEAIQNIISKYTSNLNYKKKDGKIKFLMIKSLRKGFNISLILFVFASILSFILSIFLSINYWLIFITNFFLFISFSSPITKGILQGRKKFWQLGNNLIIESSLKFVFAVSFVMFGFKVYGAIVGVLFGVLAGFVFSLFFNKDLLGKKSEKIELPGAYRNSVPYFIIMLVILLVFSLDVILAKRFFSPELAGKYAILSLLGKMIFLGTLAVSKAMFPLTTERNINNIDSKSVFIKSLILISIICVIGILLYLFFPQLIISILFGKDYIEMAPYLVYSAISLSFLSLTNLVLLYGLSVDKIRYSGYLFLFLILEVILLFLFHNSIKEYIIAFMFSNIVMFIGSFFFLKK